MRKYEISFNYAELTSVLRAMWPENRAILAVVYHTGLPVSRIVKLKPEELSGSDLHVRGVRYRLPLDLAAVLRRIQSRWYIFPHRVRSRGHRTRRAVYKDLRRACKAVGATHMYTPGYFSSLYWQ